MTYNGGDHQRRLSVAIKPDGTALLTATALTHDQGMAGMADALRRMAGDQGGFDLADEDRHDPPCSGRCYYDADELDPVKDEK